MIRLHRKLPVGLMLLLAILTGCSPTQPFYLGETGDLSYYLDKATQINYPDQGTSKSAEVEQARAPITLSNPDFDELWDLTLQETIHIALANTKILRGGSAPRLTNQAGSPSFITAGNQEGDLVTTPQIFGYTGNPAIRESGVGGESGTGVEAALANFDAQLRVFGSQGNNSIFSTTDRPQNISPTLTFFPRVLDLQNGGLISQLSKRSATGTTFTLLNQNDLSAGNQRGTQNQPLNSIWTSTIEMRVDQPLLRGRGVQINRAPVVIARLGTDVELTTLERQLHQNVANVEIRYWDLQRSYRLLETAKVARDTTLTTWQTVYQRFVNGVETAQAEAQARSQYFEFRANVEQALRGLQDNENELRFLMGLAATDGRLIRPIDEPTLAKVQFDWNESLAEAVVRRPELRSRRWEIKRRELELILARNQLLPQLDVGGFYRFLGVGDGLITANDPGAVFPDRGSNAYDELFNGNYQEFGFTGQFLLNVGMRRELAGVRNSQLNLARERAYLEDQELDVSHSLAHSFRNLDGQYVLSQTNFNRWVAGDREVKSAEAVYEQGVGQGRQPLDILLDAVRRRATAQAEYYRSIIEYNKAITFVHLRKGSILEYCGILFEEGPWTKKAYWDALGKARERDAGMYIDYGWTRPNVVSRGPVEQNIQSANGVEVLPPGTATPAERPEAAPETAPSDDATPEAAPNPSEATDMAVSPASYNAAVGGGNNAMRGASATPVLRRKASTTQTDGFWESVHLTNAAPGGTTGDTNSNPQPGTSRSNESTANSATRPASRVAPRR